MGSKIDSSSTIGFSFSITDDCSSEGPANVMFPKHHSKVSAGKSLFTCNNLFLIKSLVIQ